MVQSPSQVGLSPPTSHCSPGSWTPLPHVTPDEKQSAAHPSPPIVLQSSQTSPLAESTMQLPQRSSLRQSAEQPSPLTLFPSSQTSKWMASMTLFPQTSVLRQSPEQPSPSSMFPSSQT